MRWLLIERFIALLQPEYEPDRRHYPPVIASFTPVPTGPTDPAVRGQSLSKAPKCALCRPDRERMRAVFAARSLKKPRTGGPGDFTRVAADRR